MEKMDHMEMSDGETNIVAWHACPLEEDNVAEGQIFNGVVCCSVRGCYPVKEFVCPAFNQAVYDSGKMGVECLAFETEPEHETNTD